MLLKNAKGHATFAPLMFSPNTSRHPGAKTKYKPVPEHTNHYIRLNEAINEVITVNRIVHPMGIKMVGFTNQRQIKQSDYEDLLDPLQPALFHQCKFLTQASLEAWGTTSFSISTLLLSLCQFWCPLGLFVQFNFKSIFVIILFLQFN